MQTRLMSNPNSPQAAQTKRKTREKPPMAQKCLTTNRNAAKRNKCKQKC